MADEPAVAGLPGDITRVVPTSADLAAEALRLATVNPAQAQRLSDLAEGQALAVRNWAAVSIARTGCGRGGHPAPTP